MLRIEELRVSALAAAEKVKRSRMPFHFNPMNGRERRIIHLALRNARRGRWWFAPRTCRLRPSRF